jgi:hypothetical protein
VTQVNVERQTKTWLLALLVHSGCVQAGLEATEELPHLDEHYFRCEVQPSLTKSCAFMDCHGNDERPLRIYAQQRFRLGIDWLDYEAPLTTEELAANLQAVRGFVGTRSGYTDLLSEKPLDVRAGGVFHRAAELYGSEDVYLSTSEHGYLRLRAFIEGATAEPDCIPATESPFL